MERSFISFRVTHYTFLYYMKIPLGLRKFVKDSYRGAKTHFHSLRLRSRRVGTRVSVMSGIRQQAKCTDCKKDQIKELKQIHSDI